MSNKLTIHQDTRRGRASARAVVATFMSTKVLCTDVMVADVHGEYGSSG